MGHSEEDELSSEESESTSVGDSEEEETDPRVQVGGRRDSQGI